MSYFLAFLIRLNWIDIIALVIFIRILIVSLKNGAAAEAVKLVGALVASYVSLHYYRGAAGYCAERFILDRTAIEGLIFAILACLTYALFSFLRLLLKRFVTMEVVPAISRWGGLCLGIFRAFLLTSLLLFFFMATSNPYLRKSVKTSFSGTSLLFAAPATYGFFWNTIMSKLTPRESFNSAVFEIDQNHTKKKK